MTETKARRGARKTDADPEQFDALAVLEQSGYRVRVEDDGGRSKIITTRVSVWSPGNIFVSGVELEGDRSTVRRRVDTELRRVACLESAKLSRRAERAGRLGDEAKERARAFDALLHRLLDLPLGPPDGVAPVPVVDVPAPTSDGPLTPPQGAAALGYTDIRATPVGEGSDLLVVSAWPKGGKERWTVHASGSIDEALADRIDADARRAKEAVERARRELELAEAEEERVWSVARRVVAPAGGPGGSGQEEKR